MNKQAKQEVITKMKQEVENNKEKLQKEYKIVDFDNFDYELLYQIKRGSRDYIEEVIKEESAKNVDRIFEL